MDASPPVRGEAAEPRLGRLLKQARAAKGLTQGELAERSAVSVRTISNLEGGRITAPRHSSLRAIAAALDLSGDAVAELVAAATPGAGEAGERPRRPGGVIREPLTRLLGREEDRVALSGLIVDGGSRLVTITGMAGIGKTRLAQSVGRAAQDRGVAAWWVPLAALTSADLVLPAVAEAIGARTGTVDSIEADLPERPAVLVVDNLEHLPGADAVVQDLLARVPDVTVLATSRAPLRVAGEQEWPLRPLPVPEADTPDAVRATASAGLLVERIRSAAPAFAVTEDNAPAIAAVCRRLDGLPLAIELAAARWRVLGPDDLLGMIEANPFDLRDEGTRSPEHVSLRVALDATCSLLTDRQLAALGALSVFRGGWTREAAGAVVGGGVVSDLDGLMALGLVQAADGPTGRRFTTLPTIAAYSAELARERGLTEAAERAHASWAHRWVGSLGLTVDTLTAHAPAIGAERDNVRAALRWFAEHDPDRGVELASALYQYWVHFRHAAEGLSWLVGLLERAAPAPGRALRWSEAAWLARSLDRHADAVEHARRAVAAAEDDGDAVARVAALSTLGDVVELHEPGQGIPAHRAALALAETAGDDPMLCRTLIRLGTALCDLGSVEEPLPLLRRATDLARRLGRGHFELSSLLNAANYLNHHGRYREAREALAEAEPLLPTSGPPDAHTYWRAQTAIALVRSGEVADARRFAHHSLDDATGDNQHRHTNEAWMAAAEVAIAEGRSTEACASLVQVLSSRFGLHGPLSQSLVLAGLAVAADDPRTAAGALAAVEGLRNRYGHGLPGLTRTRVAAADARWRAELGERWDALLAERRDSPVDELVAALVAA
ncbi:ATP-binding protein [Actinokineospora guangxiensis]|uniref:ATP-binding protein n=1 Tax=Actinokineospora guangxiensis TaxID=1490288 RepID=A0ABW0EMX9_9PSEU